MGDDVDFDVALVGYGPVGQALSALLGRAGHRVAVFERFKEIYRLPRAVHMDHEIMRLLQSLGLAHVLAGELVPVHDYQWFGADGEPLLRFDLDGLARSGWDADYMFFQPALEAAIHRHACVPGGVTVERCWVADGLEACGDHVELTLRRVTEHEDGRLTPTAETRTVTARWLVGADGANSFVRQASGITRLDLGFQERWLVVDAEPRDMTALAHLPIAPPKITASSSRPIPTSAPSSLPANRQRLRSSSSATAASTGQPIRLRLKANGPQLDAALQAGNIVVIELDRIRIRALPLIP